MPKVVGSRELKTRLGRYLKEVRQGATLVVTDRGEPVAEMRPIPRGGTRQEARLEELVALGVLTRKTRGRLPHVESARGLGPSVSEAVIEDREDRF